MAKEMAASLLRNPNFSRSWVLEAVLETALEEFQSGSAPADPRIEELFGTCPLYPDF